jgi:hypothetical protein
MHGIEQGGNRVGQKNRSLTLRIAGFTKQVTTTVSDVSCDVLPIFTAATKELLAEAKSDLPKVAAELQSQMTHLSPLKKSGQSSR